MYAIVEISGKQFKVEKKQNVKSIYKFVCKSYVNNELVAQAEISAILNKDNN